VQTQLLCGFGDSDFFDDSGESRSSMVGSRSVSREVQSYMRCAAALVVFSALVLAQTNPGEKSPQSAAGTADSPQAPVATFRAYADLVLIPVTVTDRVNRYVLGLQKDDFHLLEDGVEQIALGAEVVADERQRHLGLLGDLADGDCVVAVLRKQFFGRQQDRLPAIGPFCAGRAMATRGVQSRPSGCGRAGVHERD